MRFLAFILIWVSLGVGVVAATTAYMWVVPVEGGGEQFQTGKGPEGEALYAALGADAGRTGAGEPIATADTALTPEVVERLRAGGVERVRVKEFKLSRWTHFPQFIAACIGLIAGAILTRLSAGRAARLAEQGQIGADTPSPDAALKELRAVTRALLNDVLSIGEDERACEAITQRLGAATRDLVPIIVEARDRLVARMGLGGYAGFMDVFAGAERNLNRAWSAAADGVVEESIEALERAGERLAVAEDRLTGRTPSLLPLG